MLVMMLSWWRWRFDVLWVNKGAPTLVYWIRDRQWCTGALNRGFWGVFYYLNWFYCKLLLGCGFSSLTWLVLEHDFCTLLALKMAVKYRWNWVFKWDRTPRWNLLWRWDFEHHAGFTGVFFEMGVIQLHVGIWLALELWAIFYHDLIDFMAFTCDEYFHCLTAVNWNELAVCDLYRCLA